MKWIAGVDIGNSTTEVCIGVISEKGSLQFVSSNQTTTTGTKGTQENTIGVIGALEKALHSSRKRVEDLDVILLNEAAPVIGDTAMETITETIITESTMIGHNPSTPGGIGLGTGKIIFIEDLDSVMNQDPYIIVASKMYSYEVIADKVNKARNKINITGVILQADEGVLVYNRLERKLPIIDEVGYIEKIPRGVMASVEVAPPGQSIQTLSNPYGIASLFQLTPEETQRIVPIAKSLVGNRSAVVIKTPKGEVKEKKIDAGFLYIHGPNHSVEANVDDGAEKIMVKLEEVKEIKDIEGQQGTNVGNMLNKMKETLATLTEQRVEQIYIQDLLAVDTTVPVEIQGGIAGETCMEKAVGIAAMVKTHKLPMMRVAEKLQKMTGVHTKIAGVEAVMAVLGAITTPGTKLPIAILDLGGGSTDAALLNENGMVQSIHLAGAGQLVTLLISEELGLKDLYLAEAIKKYPLAKVESLFHIRMENGEIRFYDEPLHPKYYGRVVVMAEEMIPIEGDASMEKIFQIRRESKKKVFIRNAIRALKKIAPKQEVRTIPNVVLVGGSALDFEIPEMILQELSHYKIVSGRGNIRQQEGPRNAVATGLLMHYVGG
ncbi:diol dehydratase reactivase alpha subunit [Natronincola peptidivorans]|uniref:Diol dehydratase reactivase alpha subunit n=1 Tax=Natronincola peptidivorans TaxID=426128 RepID=A0A1I0CG98_9FIRM|nr:diol dehydratase reactivase subunit alpha [Natronincola peptidivorans]SET18441.1 diol dehydratase reactivase alpha subunit [Natronincola peptidivorans]